MSKINSQTVQAAQNRHEDETSGWRFVVSSTLKAFGEHELWRCGDGNLNTPPWSDSKLPRGLVSDFDAPLVDRNEDVAWLDALGVSLFSSRQKVNQLSICLSESRTVSCA